MIKLSDDRSKPDQIKLNVNDETFEKYWRDWYMSNPTSGFVLKDLSFDNKTRITRPILRNKER